MKRTRGTLGTMTTAILAAYLLVLQALLGGLASGGHAGAAFALDEFGQVLCQGTAEGDGSPADPAHHTPDCCSTGCTFSVGTGSSPAAVALEAPVPVVVAALAPSQFRPARDAAPRHPHNARAPPLA